MGNIQGLVAVPDHISAGIKMIVLMCVLCFVVLFAQRALVAPTQLPLSLGSMIILNAGTLAPSTSAAATKPAAVRETKPVGAVAYDGALGPKQYPDARVDAARDAAVPLRQL